MSPGANSGARLPYSDLYAASAASAYMSEWGFDAAREADMRLKAETVIATARRAILSRSR